MKCLVCGFLVVGCALGAAEKPTPHPATTSRTVEVGERTVVPINALILTSTVIVLPDGEKVLDAFAGDTVNWKIDSPKVPTRYVSVKPTQEHVRTDLHVITDHGNDYSFLLSEVSGTNDTFDVKVFVDPDSQLKASINKPAELALASDVERYKKEAEDAENRAKQVATVANAKAAANTEAYRAAYPQTLHFDYEWDKKKGHELGLEQIFRDDRFTYIRTVAEEPASFYEIKDGKPSLVNFKYQDGVYVCPKLVARGELAIGKKKVEFWQKQ
ncbi:MAG TPA: TrbG/VirB9 family P-type conjugative transfer protein [Terriglobales bacterium]|nr:TrbG/VirB9 family P-type conjugative transfer protein [Terriglobales bacterium]